MSYLENRVPPPMILLISMLCMRIIAGFDNSTLLSFKLHNWVALAICIAGVAIAISAVVSFKKAQTTINPLAPESSSRLVTSGIFKLTRNPMYLGMALVGFAWGFYLASVYSLMMVAVFVVLITYFQIKPEERAMRRLFGGDFERYAKATRRWL